MVVTPQTRLSALPTCFDPLVPRFPLPEMGNVVVVGSAVATVSEVAASEVVGGGATVLVDVGTTAGLLISFPGRISGVSKEDDSWSEKACKG